MQYVFYADCPSFHDIMLRCDRELGSDERQIARAALTEAIDSIKALPRFASLNPEAVPFSRDVVRGVRERLSEAGLLGLDIEASFDVLAGLLGRFDLLHPPRWRDLNCSMVALQQMLTGSYLQRKLHRLSLYASAYDLTAHMVNDQTVESLSAELQLDPSIQHPEAVLLNATRAWNKACRSVADWPGQPLTIKTIRVVKGRAWSEYPPMLRSEVEHTLQRRPLVVVWDPIVIAAHARVEDGLAHSVDLIRICIGHLVQAGVTVTTVADIVSPENFIIIAEALYRESNAQVTRLIRTKLATLRSLFVRSELLTQLQLEEIDKFVKEHVTPKHRAFCEANPTRNQKQTDLVREPAVVRTLRELPLQIFSEVPAEGIVKRQLAAVGKQFAILAIRLDSGIPLTALRSIRMRHLSDAEDGCLLISIDASKKSWKVILTPTFSEAVRYYIRRCRPSLDLSHQSEFLFPGIDGAELHESTVSSQQSAFLKDRMPTDFTSETVRSLVKNIVFEANSQATGLAKSVLGISDEGYLRAITQAYVDQDQRQASIQMTVSGQLKAS